MKVCTACGKEKQFTEFYPQRTNADGYKRQCKRCVIDRVRARQQEVATGRATRYVRRGRPSKAPHSAANEWRKRAIDAGHCPCDSCRYVRGGTPEQRAELIARVAQEMGVAVSENRWCGPKPAMTQEQFEAHHAAIRAGRKKAATVWT